MESNRLTPLTIVSNGQHRRATYTKVCDKRKRPIRGLWEHNGRVYAQITIEEPVTGLKRVKRVTLPGKLHRTLQLLNIHPFEKVPLHELLTESEFKMPPVNNHNQLLLLLDL